MLQSVLPPSKEDHDTAAILFQLSGDTLDGLHTVEFEKESETCHDGAKEQFQPEDAHVKKTEMDFASFG